MVKLVFTDLDDTFLTTQKKITPENWAALDMLAERGMQLVPCSGRNVSMLPEGLLAHPAVRYAVCGNGSMVVDAKDRSVLMERDVPKQTVLALYGELQRLAVTFDVFADGRVYTERGRFPYMDEVDLDEPMREELKAGRTVYDGTVDGLLGRCGEVCRLNIFYHDEAERDACWAAIDARPTLRRSSSLPCNIEVTREDAHKGTALRWLCERLGVSLADVIAFGDGGNDVTMLEAAGDGVAVANAIAACKAAADHACGGCDESGVGRYLREALGA